MLKLLPLRQFPIAMVLCVTGSWVFAESQITFERIQLSDQFFAEGGATADFDQDGNGDVAVGPWVYWGPSFESSSRIYEGDAIDPRGYSANFIMDSGDVNRDGHIDIYVIGFPGEPSWWFENPGPTDSRKLWQRHVMLQSVDNESPQLSDIDGDNSPDLICSSGGHYGFATHAGQDSRQIWKFQRISPNNNYHKYTHGLGVGDVNGDGHADLLEKDGWWQNPGKPTEEFWSFHPFQFSPNGGAQMYAVDLDGDGINEIVTSLYGHGFGLVYYKSSNPGATDFQRFEIMSDNPATSSVGVAVSQLHAIAMADMNRDGVPDIVTGKRWWAHANQDPGNEQPASLLWIETLRAEQRVQFAAHIIDNSSGVGTDITTGDVNGDGLPDILSGTKRGTHLFLQRPSGLAAEQFLVPGLANKDSFDQRPATDSKAIRDGFVPVVNDRLLNWTFDDSLVQDWEIRGSISQDRPTHGWLDTGSKNLDWIGEVISRPFRLTHPKIAFRMSGGDSESAFVEVISERSGKRLAVTTSEKRTKPIEYTMDLSAAIGETVRLRVVDHSAESHVLCGQFLMKP